MAETFLEKLMRAKSVKVTATNPGSTGGTAVVPSSVIKQFRDISLDIVSTDNSVPVHELLKNPTKYSKDVEKAFRACLEGYAESRIPAPNPGRHRAQSAVDVFDSLMNTEKGFFAKKFPEESASKREQRALVLKSACLQIVDGMLNAAKIVTASKDARSQTLNENEIGMNFSDGMKGKDVAAKVAFNRYYQLTVMTWVMALVTKLYELEDSEIRPYIMEKLKDKTFGELNKTEFSKAYTKEIKDRVLRMLQDVYLPSSIK